jgi:hypothetical protein
LGYILGEFLTNSSGHPDCEEEIDHDLAAPLLQSEISWKSFKTLYMFGFF